MSKTAQALEQVQHTITKTILCAQDWELFEEERNRLQFYAYQIDQLSIKVSERTTNKKQKP